MDIGLPGLDGIEVAQRIITHNPGSKILFVSEHQSADVVVAALEYRCPGLYQQVG